MATAQVEAADWVRMQAALRDEVARVAALLRSVRKPGAPAVGSWNLAEVAMHLSQAWIVVPALARGDRSAVAEVVPAALEMAGESPLQDVWDLGQATSRGVRSDPERDTRVLAERIEARAADYLASCSGANAHQTRPWLVEGVRVPLPVFTGHLLNETIVHGYDIARAEGHKWPIDKAHAAVVIEGFLFPVVQALGPRTMVNQERAAGVRATFEVGIRGGGRHVFAFDNGSLSIGTPSSGGKVDCHISADPAGLLLVAWARKSQWAAIATGQLTAWGRKPWLSPRLRTLMRNP
jgi:hypothetical protein